VLAMGAGPIPELMTEDRADAQLQVVRRSLECGINWIDTAATYGDGRSEQGIGRVLTTLDARDDIHVATKVRLMPDELQRQPIRDIVRRSLENSLTRLQLDRVTLLQLHNSVTKSRGDLPTSLTPEDVLGPDGVLRAMQRLREDGLVTHLGFTGLGDPVSLRQLIASGQFETMQIPYHLLNPTAGQQADADWVETDHGGLMNDCLAAGMGVFPIRIYAGGALLGRPPARHTHTTKFFPMELYKRDRQRARELSTGLAPGQSLQAEAVRFALAHPATSSAIIGFSEPEHVDAATTAVLSGDE